MVFEATELDKIDKGVNIQRRKEGKGLRLNI